jgi:hypothetical protein
MIESSVRPAARASREAVPCRPPEIAAPRCALGAEARAIHRSERWLVALDPLQNQMAASFFNGAPLIVLFNILVLIDLAQAAFELEPNIQG